MDHEGRIRRVRDKLDGAGVDALLVTNLTNVRYLTGFSGSNGQVLVTDGGAVFFSDPCYAARAGDLVVGAEIAIYPARLTDLLPERLAAAGTKRLGIEGASMTLATRDDLDERLEGIELVTTKDVVEELRRAKEPAEVALIKSAVRIADDTFAWALDRLAPGSSERAIALDVEMRMRQNGAEAVAFEPIVGSGPLSAHIHHTPSERVLEKGDVVLLDFGCRVDGYCSDLTRTVVLGAATDEQQRIYDLVLRAQATGTAAIAAGKGGAEVDAAARKVIADAGHGDDFGHGLGHGVGLDVHEAPRLHRISEDTLVAGDVVTVEPGVYVVGSGGIRIEDCVLVTDGGAEVLTGAPKEELIEL
ncbi:MAG: M24 family metallopeptidase [Actinomycetota bacterium]